MLCVYFSECSLVALENDFAQNFAHMENTRKELDGQVSVVLAAFPIICYTRFPNYIHFFRPLYASLA